MEKDRDQLTPDDPDDRTYLEQHRGQGTGGTGLDRLEGEEPPGSVAADDDGSVAADDDDVAPGEAGAAGS